MNCTDIVWVVETTYKNGHNELNALYWNKEDADKFAEFIRKHDGTNDMFIENINVRDVFVHGESDIVEAVVNDVFKGYEHDVDAGVASMIKAELIERLK